jgi:hypothetical protein
MPPQPQRVRLITDDRRGDVADAVRRLRAALPEAEVDGPGQDGQVVVVLAAATPEEAADRIDAILASSREDDPLRASDRDHRDPN